MKNHTLLAVVSILAVSGSADADRRQSTLPTDVAVRHRRLLVKNRFELAPLFESTINADFRHIIGGGAKLEYHLGNIPLFGDTLSIGVVGVGSTAINTKLVDKIRPTLEPTIDNKTREPSQDEFMNRLNAMPVHGAGYLSLTPWYGKLAAFGQAYVAFDFYFQAGISYAQLKSNCPATVCSDMSPGSSHEDSNGVTVQDEMPLNPNNDPPLNNGSRVGVYLGGGIHVFLNDFLALDMTVRDYAFTDNPSGADFNADLIVSSADNRFLHHLFFGVGISVMLPTTVKRTP